MKRASQAHQRTPGYPTNVNNRYHQYERKKTTPLTSTCVQWYLVRMYTQQKNKQTGIAQLEKVNSRKTVIRQTYASSSMHDNKSV